MIILEELEAHKYFFLDIFSFETDVSAETWTNASRTRRVKYMVLLKCLPEVHPLTLQKAGGGSGINGDGGSKRVYFLNLYC